MSGTPKQLNIAMIGNGFIARAHSNAFNQVKKFFDVPFELKLKVLCGRNQTKVDAFARQWDWEEIATDWHQAVTRNDIDVVDIAVPNMLHAPIALAALAAGKIVFCEKPLAMTMDEAEAMASTARRLPNLVWFNYRRIPAVAFAKQLIEEGRLGVIYHYRGYYFNQSGVDPAKGQTWRYRQAEAGSGVIGDLLSHSLDMALYLNSDIAELSAVKHTFMPNREVDDAVTAMARFTNGSLGVFEASRFGVGRRNGLGFEIYGSKGSMAFDLEEMDRLGFLDAADPANLQAYRDILVTGPDHPYWSNFWKPGHMIGYEHTFIATLGDFLKCLETGETFRPNFDDAARIQLLLETVESSASSKRWTKVQSGGVR
jgi:predicted dehydrogenase